MNNEQKKRYNTFQAQFSGSFSERLAAALSQVSTWMGDRLDPRSKSELQLETIIFFLHIFLFFFYIQAFSFNFRLYEIIKVVDNGIFHSKFKIDFSQKKEISIQSKICYIQQLQSIHMVKNLMKKPKKTKKAQKMKKKFLHFSAVTHPSTDWARCCLTLGSLSDLQKFV